MSDRYRTIRDEVTHARAVQPPEGGAFADVGGFDGDIDGFCSWRPQNDLGNAARLVRRFCADLIHVREAGWHGWDGRRWDRVRGTDMAQLRAQETVEAIRAEAAAAERAGDNNRAKHLAGWARDSGSSGRIAALQREAAPHLACEPDALDRNPDLLNAANGTVELGVRCTMRPFDRADLLTHASEVPFDDAAIAPVFETFVRTILPDEEIRGFVQRWLGYCLTGHTREQVVVMFLGLGSNGKSTLLNLAAQVAGDLHLTLPIATFADDRHRSGGDATPDLARLPGARMVTTSEPRIGMTLSESRIKELTGGEEISVRHLNRGFFEFKPQCKITMSFNNRPRIRGQDHGTWRRFLLVPFDVVIGPEHVAPVLKAFEDEKPGILRWLLDGAEQWYEGGLQVPQRITEATSEFRSEQDALSLFLQDMCQIGDEVAAERVRFKELWTVWTAWCKEQNEDPGTTTMMGKKLQERGFRRDKAGDVFYAGLKLAEGALRTVRDGPDGLEGEG